MRLLRLLSRLIIPCCILIFGFISCSALDILRANECKDPLYFTYSFSFMKSNGIMYSPEELSKLTVTIPISIDNDQLGEGYNVFRIMPGENRNAEYTISYPHTMKRSESRHNKYALRVGKDEYELTLDLFPNKHGTSCAKGFFDGKELDSFIDVIRIVIP